MRLRGRANQNRDEPDGAVPRTRKRRKKRFVKYRL